MKRAIPLLLALIACAPPAAAASFSDGLTGTVLNSAFTVSASDSSFAATPGVAGLRLTRSPATGNGYVQVLSTFTFSGAFSLSVDAAGLRTGLDSLGEAGLAVTSNGGAGSDIFSFNNNPGYANNFAGLTLSDTQLGSDLDRLSISGDTNGAQYGIVLFLLQEYGGTSTNAATFSNLALQAAVLTPAAPVPETGEWAMMLTGLTIVGALARRRAKPESRP